MLQNTIYALSLLLAIFTITSNILIIGLFLAHKDIRIARNYIIFSLAIADLLIGILAIPFAAHQNYVKIWPFSSQFCYSHVILDVMITLVSLFTVALTSGLDTILVYGRPTNGRSKVYSPKNVALLIALGWLGPVGSLLIPLVLNPNYVKLFMERTHVEDYRIGDIQCLPNFPEKLYIGLVVFYYQVMIAFIVCAYVAIFCKMQKRGNFLARNRVASIHVASHHRTLNTADQRFYRNKKFLRLTFSMAILACVCYLPGSIVFFMESLSYTSIPLWAFNFGIWLSYLKSALNPLLYGFLNAKFKAHICNIFGKKMLPSSSLGPSTMAQNDHQEHE